MPAGKDQQYQLPAGRSILLWPGRKRASIASLQMPYLLQEQRLPPPGHRHRRAFLHDDRAFLAVAADVLQVDQVRLMGGEETVRAEEFAKLADIVRADDVVPFGRYYPGEALQPFATAYFPNFQELHAFHSRNADQVVRRGLIGQPAEQLPYLPLHLFPVDALPDAVNSFDKFRRTDRFEQVGAGVDMSGFCARLFAWVDNDRFKLTGSLFKNGTSVAGNHIHAQENQFGAGALQ